MSETHILSSECKRPWEVPREHWRADWIDDTDDLHYWCPICWQREFDDDRV